MVAYRNWETRELQSETKKQTTQTATRRGECNTGLSKFTAAAPPPFVFLFVFLFIYAIRRDEEPEYDFLRPFYCSVIQCMLFMYVKEAGGGQDAWLSRTLKAWRRSSRGIFNQRTNTKISSSFPFQIFFFFFQPRREREENESTISDVAFLFVFFFHPSYVISSFPSIATKITKLCCCPISFFILPPFVASYCRGSTRILSCVGWK